MNLKDLIEHLQDIQKTYPKAKLEAFIDLNNKRYDFDTFYTTISATKKNVLDITVTEFNTDKKKEEPKVEEKEDKVVEDLDDDFDSLEKPTDFEKLLDVVSNGNRADICLNKEKFKVFNEIFLKLTTKTVNECIKTLRMIKAPYRIFLLAEIFCSDNNYHFHDNRYVEALNYIFIKKKGCEDIRYAEYLKIEAMFGVSVLDLLPNFDTDYKIMTCKTPKLQDIIKQATSKNGNVDLVFVKINGEIVVISHNIVIGKVTELEQQGLINYLENL